MSFIALNNENYDQEQTCRNDLKLLYHYYLVINHQFNEKSSSIDEKSNFNCNFTISMAFAENWNLESGIHSIIFSIDMDIATIENYFFPLFD